MYISNKRIKTIKYNKTVHNKKKFFVCSVLTNKNKITTLFFF